MLAGLWKGQTAEMTHLFFGGGQLAIRDGRVLFVAADNPSPACSGSLQLSSGLRELIESGW